MGNLSFNNGKRDEAEKYYLDALALALEVGDKMGAAQDHTYLGNLRFKGEKFDEAEVDFDKAGTLFEEVQNATSRAQLFLTVARMELVVSRVDSCGKYLDLAKKVSKELGDPKPITQAIEEIEKMKQELSAQP